MITKKKRQSVRLKEYDYSKNGAYFVTICARGRECIFADLTDHVGAGLASARKAKPSNQLTTIGLIVDKNWRDIHNQFENVTIDEFVIMPNHLHGIIIIYSNGQRATARVAPTLSDVIASFKSRSVNDYLKYIQDRNLSEKGKIWQRNYYERIIRNERSLQAIREYIANNPMTWLDDENNPLNIK